METLVWYLKILEKYDLCEIMIYVSRSAVDYLRISRREKMEFLLGLAV